MSLSFQPVVAITALTLSLVLGSGASAEYREFSGRVAKIDTETLVVDNRRGDQVMFGRLDETQVSGQKSAWQDLQRNDWVTVDWKMGDRPRRAYEVRVLPPKE